MFPLLGVALWILSKLLLAGVLVLIHGMQQRRRAVPAPLFQRTLPVPAKTRLIEGLVGCGACYALCVSAYFSAYVGQPMGASLTLNPIEGSPAETAGMSPGDHVRRVGGKPVKSFEEFREVVAKSPEPVSIEVERDGHLVPLSIRKNEKNLIGVVPEPGEPAGAGAAFARAIVAPVMFSTAMLGATVRRAVGEETPIAGPVAIGAAASGGDGRFTLMLALLMTRDLIAFMFIYLVVLVADARSRAQYQVAQR